LTIGARANSFNKEMIHFLLLEGESKKDAEKRRNKRTRQVKASAYAEEGKR